MAAVLGNANTFIMLKVYADESGLTHRSPYCLVMGYLGTVEQWENVERQWASLLTQNDLPCFHAKDFFAFGQRETHIKSPYREWGNEQSDQFLAELAHVIDDHNLVLVGAAVVKADFERLSENERRWVTGAGYNHKLRRLYSSGAPNKPYFAGLASVIQRTIVVEPSGDIVQFILDQQDQFSPWALSFYQQFKSIAPPTECARLGGLSFQDKCNKRFIGLQTSDLAVHLWHRYLTKGLSGRRQTVMNILSAKRDNCYLDVLNADVMNRLVDQLPKGVLAKGYSRRKR